MSRMYKRTIVLTGGGTAGHVSVNLALIPHLRKEGWNVHYIGSHQGIERELVDELEGVTYHGISSGKLRRYFDWNNLKDPFKVGKGVVEAYRLIRSVKPIVIFSKGGFVSVPVVIGGWLNRVPVVIHESDVTPGLANKLSIPFAAKVCTTFPETERYLKGAKTEHVGAVVRESLLYGKAEKGREACGFSGDRPVLLVMGGSLGSQKINSVIRNNLAALTDTMQIVHLCGKGNVDHTINNASYRQFEYVTDELSDLLAMSDAVVSRAGSNAIYEFLVLQKPMLLIPLSRAASRGDQIANAESFRKRGFAKVLKEEQLSDDTFLAAITELLAERERFQANMREQDGEHTLQHLIGIIKAEAR